MKVTYNAMLSLMGFALKLYNMVYLRDFDICLLRPLLNTSSVRLHSCTLLVLSKGQNWQISKSFMFLLITIS